MTDLANNVNVGTVPRIGHWVTAEEEQDEQVVEQGAEELPPQLNPPPLEEQR